MFKHFGQNGADGYASKVIASKSFANALFGLKNRNNVAVPKTSNVVVQKVHVRYLISL